MRLGSGLGKDSYKFPEIKNSLLIAGSFMLFFFLFGCRFGLGMDWLFLLALSEYLLPVPPMQVLAF